MLLVSPPSTSFLSGFNGNRFLLVRSKPLISSSASYRNLQKKQILDTLLNPSRICAKDPLGLGNHDINDVTLDWGETLNEGDEELSSPWEGAVIFKRNPAVSHLEYCTTLERLGLAMLSTDVSRSRASDMGLRCTKSETEYPQGTPVQISMDVTSKKARLRLDGIIKTVISLYCHRCGEPTTETVYSNFAVLLDEAPIEEDDLVDMGMFFRETKQNSLSSDLEVDEDAEDEQYVNWDEKLHFPLEDKQIDISKLVRDMVHVEMTIDSVCDSSCKGLCVNCGTNLNKGVCYCSVKNKSKNSYNPFRNLRSQIQLGL